MAMIRGLSSTYPSHSTTQLVAIRRNAAHRSTVVWAPGGDICFKSLPVLHLHLNLYTVHRASADNNNNGVPDEPETTPSSSFTESAGKKPVPRTAESTDWIASSLTKRFGLAGGLAWFGFLAFGVISEQVKTRLEVFQQSQNVRDVEDAKEVALPNGVKYADLRVGGGPSPFTGDIVVIGLQCKIKNSRDVFIDSFEKGKRPLVFVMGAKPYSAGLCDALVEVIKTMKTGGRRRVFVPSDLAFGNSGALLPNNVSIPPGSDLEYVVELQKTSIPP